MESNIALLLQVLSVLLETIGLWQIFRKCGVKSWYSLIPFVREYQLGLCADKEEEGRTYTVISGTRFVLQLANIGLVEGSREALIVLLIQIVLQLAIIVYEIRIYLGLIKVFRRRKRWILGFIFLEGLTVFLWGISKKFVPSKQVVNFKLVEGAKVSGSAVKAVSDGLTINIRERSVFDFFKKRALLKDIHIVIPKGHMVLLLGGSGAGKTTFVNAVTGYEKADADIQLDGQDVYKEYEKMMYDIGFVPQQDLMRGNDTVMLTLTDAASLRMPSGVSFSKKRERVNEVLQEFGLASVKNSLVEKLSGGQRKRLSIAMEFISDPTIFFLDEPDSGLDGVVARNLFVRLRAIADQGKIVVVITHTPDRVIDLFDDVIVLAKDATRTGRLAWYGPVDEAYEFFGKTSMEQILLSINQQDEGGEGRADEFVSEYASRMRKVG